MNIETLTQVLPPEQQEMLTMLNRMMETQGNGRQSALFQELSDHLTAIMEILNELRYGYVY